MILDPRNIPRFRAMCRNDRHIFFAGGHNGNMLMVGELKPQNGNHDEDNDDGNESPPVELQSFANERIRFMSCNNRIVVACNRLQIAVFGCSNGFPRLAQVCYFLRVCFFFLFLQCFFFFLVS